ncbi:MAG: hydrogenase expression/formation protein HypE [Bernardetiaceae bacterium]
MPLSLQCPMPQVDFELITLGHGSGGLLTQKLLESGVFDLFKNEHLDQRHDGAILNLTGKMAFSTDTFLVSPIRFPGGDIGDLAINGTANDLAMCGAMPRYFSLSFILEEGLPFAEFWEVLLSLQRAAKAAGIQIVTGDTKVVEKGKGDKIFINTSGIGQVHPRAHIARERVQVGDVLVLSGPIAAHGMAIMSVREGLEFESEIRSDTAAVHHTVSRLLDRFGEHIHLLHDPTRGGLATVLKETAEATRLGIRLLQSSIPIDEQVSSACEILGLDPLYVANEGIFLSIVAAQVAEDYVTTLRTDPHGTRAAIIGEMVAEHPRQVILRGGIGGERVITMLPGEQLPRIC